MTNIPVVPGELVDTGYLNEVARAHYRKTTSKQVLNSIVETDLFNGEITIGAGAMSTNRALRILAVGDWIQNSAAARDIPRFKLKLGATTLIDTNITGLTPVAASANRYAWRIEASVHNLGATNAQWVSFKSRLIFGLGAAIAGVNPTTGTGATETILSSSTTGARTVDSDIGGSSAVDTTVAQVLALTTTNPTNVATCDVTLAAALVEIV